MSRTIEIATALDGTVGNVDTFVRIVEEVSGTAAAEREASASHADHLSADNARLKREREAERAARRAAEERARVLGEAARAYLAAECEQAEVYCPEWGKGSKTDKEASQAATAKVTAAHAALVEALESLPAGAPARHACVNCGDSERTAITPGLGVLCVEPAPCMARTRAKMDAASRPAVELAQGALCTACGDERVVHHPACEVDGCDHEEPCPDCSTREAEVEPTPPPLVELAQKVAEKLRDRYQDVSVVVHEEPPGNLHVHIGKPGNVVTMECIASQVIKVAMQRAAGASGAVEPAQTEDLAELRLFFETLDTRAVTPAEIAFARGAAERLARSVHRGECPQSGETAGLIADIEALRLPEFHGAETIADYRAAHDQRVATVRDHVERLARQLDDARRQRESAAGHLEAANQELGRRTAERADRLAALEVRAEKAERALAAERTARDAIDEERNRLLQERAAVVEALNDGGEYAGLADRVRALAAATAPAKTTDDEDACEVCSCGPSDTATLYSDGKNTICADCAAREYLAPAPAETSKEPTP